MIGDVLATTLGARYHTIYLIFKLRPPEYKGKELVKSLHFNYIFSSGIHAYIYLSFYIFIVSTYTLFIHTHCFYICNVPK
jgi:hypothetical protein